MCIQVRQLKLTNILNFRNLLARADCSSVLSTTDANETYDNFMLIHKALYEISCPIKSIRGTRKYLKRKPLVTSGISTSSIYKAKLLRKKLNKPGPETTNAHREYCRMFNKIKRAAKTKYYTEMLDQRKHSIKETWAVLRQVIHKQKESFKLPETYIINGQEISNSYRIAEEFNKLFIGIGKSVDDSMPLPISYTPPRKLYCQFKFSEDCHILSIKLL